MYIMEVHNGLCYLRDGRAKGRHLEPDPTNPENPDTEAVMRDYAVLMKLPNFLSHGESGRKQTIMLFAGCKVAGQVALTEWVANPLNLARLASEYSSKYFQIIFEVHYRFVPGGVPNVLEIEPIISEEVKVPVREALDHLPELEHLVQGVSPLLPPSVIVPGQEGL